MVENRIVQVIAVVWSSGPYQLMFQCIASMTVGYLDFPEGRKSKLLLWHKYRKYGNINHQ